MSGSKGGRSRVSVDNRSLAHMLRILRREYEKREAPVVALIALTTHDPYRVLAGCILSLRTQDATTAAAAERLFTLAPDLDALSRADVAAVRRAIYPVGFYNTKAAQLVAMAREIVTNHDGRVPDDIESLLTLKGVGRKTANLVVTVGYGKPGICVDTHVHRISNRWGYVRTDTPDQTEQVLRRRLPRRQWLRFNDLLVSFGQTVCRPTSPRCSVCPISRRCPRIGVVRSR